MKSKVLLTSAALMVSIGSSSVCASVASRVQESNSYAHSGVLAFVRDPSPTGLKIEKYFFGLGVGAVASAAPGFQIQIVEPSDVPGGALPGSFVVLTPFGNRVVAMQRGYNTMSDLAAFMTVARQALDFLPAATATILSYTPASELTEEVRTVAVQSYPQP